MKRSIAVALGISLLLQLAACSSDNVTVSTTSGSTTTATETTTTTSSSASSSEELSYCDSGLLKGLRIDKDNIFVKEDPAWETLTAYMENTAVNKGFNGSCILATDDEIIFYGGPNAKTTKGDPVDPYTIYEIGSISKTFTAVLIMKLREAGKIDLNDKLTKYFPEYKKGENITIANLLNMQSGIKDYVNNPMSFFSNELSNDEFLEMFAKDSLTDESFMDYLCKADFDFEPGTDTDYSNTNYHLLALIIEKIEGMSYADVVKRDIFDPLGMEHSSAVATGDVTSVADEFKGYHSFQKGARGAGDIHSCMADMLIFDKALFGGKLVNEESLGIMRDYKTGKSYGDGGYGCGLYPYIGKAFGHSGATTSYVSQNVIIETEEFGRVYFIGSSSTVRGVDGFQELLDRVLSNLA